MMKIFVLVLIIIPLGLSSASVDVLDEGEKEEDTFISASSSASHLSHSLVDSNFARRSQIPGRQKRDGQCGEKTILQTFEKEEARRMHNFYRSKQGSSNMLNVTWSEELADRAQELVSRCRWGHGLQQDCAGQVIGQNLAIKLKRYSNITSLDIAGVVKTWYKQKLFYIYDKQSCAPRRKCTRYTQLVWATTKEVGCGAAYCSNMVVGRVRYKYSVMVVCNYRTTGNADGVVPFKKGPACSDCADNPDLKGFKCVNNLCVDCDPAIDKDCPCTIRKCENGGVWDTQKCGCFCAAGYYGELCEHSCKCENTGKMCHSLRIFCKVNAIKFFKEYMHKKCKKTCNTCVSSPLIECQDREPVNECEQNTTLCGEHADCRDTPSSYECLCHTGFALIDGNCHDIDECAQYEYICGFYSQCQNYIGGYNCSCHEGFKEENGQCIDIDECANSTFCDELERCLNEIGSYQCLCQPGFQKREGICEDTDECTQTPYPCGVYGNCVNYVGGYNCTCQYGFELYRGRCLDTDECVNTSACGQNEKCTNTLGSYKCMCVNGYAMQGEQCVDFDECEHNECEGGECENYEGGFNCTCPDGFEVKHGKCRDSKQCFCEDSEKFVKMCHLWPKYYCNPRNRYYAFMSINCPKTCGFCRCPGEF